MNESLNLNLGDGVEDLEAEDFNSARCRARAATDNHEHEEERHNEAAPLIVIVIDEACSCYERYDVE